MCDLILPRKCKVCGNPLTVKEELLCTGCMSDIPFTYFWNLPHNAMSDRMNEMIQKDLASGGIIQPHERYAHAVALFYYDPGNGYSNITRGLKYHGDLKLGHFFGKMLGEKIRDAAFLKDVDLIVPVPLHWTRRWKRGYNQAETIAEAISETTGVRAEYLLLKRSRMTASQTRLGAEDKKKNVEGAFEARHRSGLHAIRHILLVDDVFTTGATVNACHRALRQELGENVAISAATLAFVGE